MTLPISILFVDTDYHIIMDIDKSDTTIDVRARACADAGDIDPEAIEVRYQGEVLRDDEKLIATRGLTCASEIECHRSTKWHALQQLKRLQLNATVDEYERQIKKGSEHLDLYVHALPVSELTSKQAECLLHASIHASNISFVKTLLLHDSADFSSSYCTNGFTPLMKASFINSDNSLQIATAIVNHGVDINLVDFWCLSALDYACANQHASSPMIASMLRSNGATSGKGKFCTFQKEIFDHPESDSQEDNSKRKDTPRPVGTTVIAVTSTEATNDSGSNLNDSASETVKSAGSPSAEAPLPDVKSSITPIPDSSVAKSAGPADSKTTPELHCDPNQKS